MPNLDWVRIREGEKAHKNRKNKEKKSDLKKLKNSFRGLEACI
jgi:hypothetical protein